MMDVQHFEYVMDEAKAHRELLTPEQFVALGALERTLDLIRSGLPAKLDALSAEMLESIETTLRHEQVIL